MMVLSVWCAPFLSQYYILPSTRETKEILEQKRKKEEKKGRRRGRERREDTYERKQLFLVYPVVEAELHGTADFTESTI